jgi:hypothetical protein
MGKVTLSTSPEKRFSQLERIIEKGMKHFVEVGTALSIIKKEKLYKEALGFSTFEEYCKERWGFSRVHAHRLVEAAKVNQNLLPIGNKPTSESQIRPLAHLEAEQQKKVWERAVKTAPKGKMTAKHVEKTVKEYLDPEGALEKGEIIDQSKEDEDTPIIQKLKECWSEANRYEKTMFIDWLKKEGEF